MGRRKKLDGVYYRFSCGNSHAAGLYPASDFDGDGEAIQMAMDYEAPLFKVWYKDGEYQGQTLIFDFDDELED